MARITGRDVTEGERSWKPAWTTLCSGELPSPCCTAFAPNMYDVRIMFAGM